MKKVDKNPIALLNEFATRLKTKIAFQFEYKKGNRRHLFFCKVTQHGRSLCSKLQEGESKQEAKTLAALDAIRLLEKNEAHKNEMVYLLQRLEKKGAYQEEYNKVKNPVKKITSIQDVIKQLYIN